MKNRNIFLSGTAVGIVFFVVFMFAGSAFSAEIKQDIQDLLNSGDTTKAITRLNEDIEIDPSFEKNYYTLGMIYKKREFFDKAEQYFAMAVEKKKKFWPGVYELGLMQLELGKIDEAEKNFKEGVKKAKDKDQANFHNGMALVLIAREQYSDADTELRKAMVIDDKDPIYHINLGKVYIKQGVNALAISEFDKAVQMDTLSLDIYYDWAEACIEMKDFQCALEKLSVVLSKDSTHAPAWMKAGGIYYKAARSSRSVQEIKELYGKTIGAYEKYIELANATPDSSNGRAYYEAGMAYLVLRYYQEAQNYFSEVLSIPVIPKDIYFNYGKAWQGVAWILQSEGAKPDTLPQFDSAIVYFEKHIEWVREMQAQSDFKSGVDDEDLYRTIGECYEAKKDRFNTISYYKKSLEYNANQPRLLYGVAVAYNYVQDYRNALIYYMKRIEQGIDEKYWSIYYNAATSALYLAEKGPGAAEEEEDLGLDEEFVEDTAPAEDELAGVNFYDLAIEYLEKIANDYWETVISNERNMNLALKTLNMLGSTYLYQKSDCANGIKYYERSLELDKANCEALRSMGYAYFGGICNQSYSRALSYLNQALSCNATNGDEKCKDVELLVWLAQAYEFRAIEKSDAKDNEGKKADYAKADEWYLEVLKCDPNNNDAKEGHRRCKWEH